MGWVGPHATKLRLLPLPRLRRKRSGGVRLRSFDASATAMPGGLAEALDAIDAGKPEAQLRRIRAADDWRMRLTARPRRSYRFYVIEAGGKPIGYFAVRPTDEEAGRQYRLARLHYVTDAVFNSDDLETMSSAFHALAGAVPGVGRSAAPVHQQQCDSGRGHRRRLARRAQPGPRQAPRGQGPAVHARRTLRPVRASGRAPDLRRLRRRPQHLTLALPVGRPPLIGARFPACWKTNGPAS